MPAPASAAAAAAVAAAAVAAAHATGCRAWRGVIAPDRPIDAEQSCRGRRRPCESEPLCARCCVAVLRNDLECSAETAVRWRLGRSSQNWPGDGEATVFAGAAAPAGPDTGVGSAGFLYLYCSQCIHAPVLNIASTVE